MIEQYNKQLNNKKTRISQQFNKYLVDTELDVFTSTPQNFRQRAEFRVWHERDSESNNTGEVFFAMFESGQKASKKTLQRVDQLPIASVRINELMPLILEELQKQPILIERLFQVEFLSTLSGETLVTLIYHKVLDEKWQELAQQLEKKRDIYIIGRSRKQKVVLTQDFVTETLTVHNKKFDYKQIESGFTQPNAKVCEKMLEWACEQAMQAGSERDLLELYCGNGNFTLPLSKYFRKVLATEVSKTSVRSARYNIEKNNCENIAIARLSAEEFTQAFTGEREFNRLKQDNIVVSDYDVSTIFVDPPRAGIDDDTLKLMQQFDNIIYISCNPDTLFDNLETLTKTHTVVRMAMFDQFPYTHHIEMGVYLQKIV